MKSIVYSLNAADSGKQIEKNVIFSFAIKIFLSLEWVRMTIWSGEEFQ